MVWFDVIVIGGGLAALCAAIEAAEMGASVGLFADSIGGNSLKASSGLSAAHTDAQRERGIEDSVEAHFRDTLASSGATASKKLVKTLVEGGADAVRFLSTIGKLETPLTDVVRLGGHSVARTHRPVAGSDGKTMPVGIALMRSLERVVRATKNIAIHEGRRVVGVNRTCSTSVKDERVECGFVLSLDEKGGDGGGVSGDGGDRGVREEVVEGRAVILATGGYSRALEVGDKEVAASLASLPSTNGPGASGDGLRLGTALGGMLVGLEHVQVHPTGFVDPREPDAKSLFLAPEALRGVGGILLSPVTGLRFTSELLPRDELTAAIWKEWGCDDRDGGGEEGCGKRKEEAWAWLVLDKDAARKFGDAFVFYHRVKGFFTAVEGVEGLTERMKAEKEWVGSGEEEIVKSIDEGRSDPKSAAALLNPKQELFVAKVRPAIHYTMGGVAIDERARLLAKRYDEKWEEEEEEEEEVEMGEEVDVVEGVYAAGEVTGGVHGKNRLGGNSLLECVVFGRIAGREAAAWGKKYGIEEE